MKKVFFDDNVDIICSILNRIANCMDFSKISVLGKSVSMEQVYKDICIQPISCLEQADLTSLIFIICENKLNHSTIQWIRDHKFDCTMVVYCLPDVDIKGLNNCGSCYSLDMFNNISGNMFFIGKCFEYDYDLNVPNNFKVLAIIHVFNEVDIIEETVKYLIGQKLYIYIVDNWSTDGSYEIVKSLQQKYQGRIFLERFPRNGKNEFYDWYHQLERTEQISQSENYNWYIHYDADEIRLSPWENVSLCDAIYYIDTLGYNLIENTVIDFKMTDENEKTWVMDGWFDFGHRRGHFEQTKTWKKNTFVELKNTGGHIAEVENPRIFPLKFLNRHYPLRTIEQAEKKIYRDRLPRFEKEQKERGWHGHYNNFIENSIEIEDKKSLIRWDEKTCIYYFIPLFLGVGIYCEPSADLIIPNYDISKNETIAIYGAGNIGRALYKKLIKKYRIVCWIDKKNAKIPRLYGRKVEKIQKVIVEPVDKIIVAIENETVANEVKMDLAKMGYKGDIIWKEIHFQK